MILSAPSRFKDSFLWGAEYSHWLRRHSKAVRLRLRSRHVVQHDGADLHQGDPPLHGAGAGAGKPLQSYGMP